MNDMLAAENIYKTYRDGKRSLEVLKGINLEIHKGEFLAVVGPSGAGKSTLLHIMGGLDRPSAGNVLLDKKNFYALGDREQALLRSRKIGFVFQFYHLLPEFTALENVELALAISGRQRHAARRLLESVGLKSRLHHRPAELSGGESQRVAIARAMANEPELLLCDEPTGNLDSATGEEITALLKSVHRQKGSALVMVTHNEALAKQAGRVVRLRDGRIE